MSVAFTVRMVPPKTTAQQKGTMAIIDKSGKYRGLRHYKKKKTIQAENDLINLFAAYAPAQPMEGPIYLLLRYIYPWRSTEKKKNIALGEMPMDKRPDADNLAKMTGDVLTKLLFYHDDSQIADLRIQKFWGSDPGITVVIREIEVKQPTKEVTNED